MSCSLKRQSPSAASVTALCNGTPYPPVRVAAMFCTSPSAVNSLVSQSAPFCCLPFSFYQFLSPSTHPNSKTDTLPRNVLLSTKWRAISLRWVIQCRLEQNNKWSCELLLQQNYHQQLISGTFQICSCPSVHSTYLLSQFVTAGAVLYRNVDCKLKCFSCCTVHEGRHLSIVTAENLRIQFILHWTHYTN